MLKNLNNNTIKKKINRNNIKKLAKIEIYTIRLV